MLSFKSQSSGRNYTHGPISKENIYFSRNRESKTKCEERLRRFYCGRVY